ncbi:MAG: Transglutaminase [Bacteroidetes bacterium]|nr:Transglutaminase [Bacteroidota bacterium]
MKRFIFPFFFLFFLPLVIFSQNFSLKFGSVTEDELNMKAYEKDTSAAAVVLYDIGNTYYIYSSDFQVVTENSRKIKILKQEGTKYADVELIYSASDNNSEYINKLEAYTYNLENGKIVKSKVEKNYIFDEKSNKTYHRIKFTFPNVKAGSILEFKYKRTSGRYFDIPDKIMQEDIPIRYISYEILIPEYFIYNIESRGYENIKAKNEIQRQTFTIISNVKGYTVSCSSNKSTYSMTDVPALKDEAYVWNLDDYRSAVRFELNGTKFPNSDYKPYTNTWADIEKLLKENSEFLTNTKKSTSLDEAIKINKTGSNDKDNIQTIFSLIKGKVKWNNEYSLFENEPREAIKKGTGNNAQINSILISTLMKAGYNAYPVLISQRSSGKLPYSYPSIDRLSTFIVGVDGFDGKAYYLDGSSDYGGVNMMPVDLLVERGYIIDDTKTEKWVDLTNLANNREIYIVTGKLDKDGVMKATLNHYLSNEDAFYFKKDFKESKDSAEFIENFETKHDIKISNVNLKGMDMLSADVENTMEFTKNYELAGDYIYINPFIFRDITSNPFTSSERKLPIEFAYPYVYNYTATIQIPENYTISEMPSAVRIVLNDKQGSCLYNIAQNGNSILVNYRFNLKQTIFPHTDYTAIQGFWGQAATKNNEMIVLRKN